MQLPRYVRRVEVRAVRIKSVLLHDPTGTGKSDAFGIPLDSATQKFEGGHIITEPDSACARDRGELGHAISFEADWYRKHRPSPGGYYVVEGGEPSYWTKEDFEQVHQLVGGPQLQIQYRNGTTEVMSAGFGFISDGAWLVVGNELGVVCKRRMSEIKEISLS